MLSQEGLKFSLDSEMVGPDANFKLMLGHQGPEVQLDFEGSALTKACYLKRCWTSLKVVLRASFRRLGVLGRLSRCYLSVDCHSEGSCCVDGEYSPLHDYFG